MGGPVGWEYIYRMMIDEVVFVVLGGVLIVWLAGWLPFGLIPCTVAVFTTV